jgi:hypothetical protein
LEQIANCYATIVVTVTGRQQLFFLSSHEVRGNLSESINNPMSDDENH